MKVFRVVWEEDGPTIKEPGIVETEIKRHEYRYAAETIGQVWDAIDDIRNDPERELIAVHEEHPAITVLQSPVSEHGGQGL